MLAIMASTAGQVKPALSRGMPDVFAMLSDGTARVLALEVELMHKYSGERTQPVRFRPPGKNKP